MLLRALKQIGVSNGNMGETKHIRRVPKPAEEPRKAPAEPVLVPEKEPVKV